MFANPVHPATGEAVRAALCHKLAQGDAMVEAALPILRLLVATDDRLLFSDRVLATVRGMLDALASGLGELVPLADRTAAADLPWMLAGNGAILSHVHATALEWALTEQLQDRFGTDPVVTPLLGDLVDADDPEMRGLARAFLAAQTRWSQESRRMTLACGQLPGELVDAAFQVMEEAWPDTCLQADAAIRQWRDDRDEQATRTGLAVRLVARLADGGAAALMIERAGPALFFSALALGSGQTRDGMIFAAHDGRLARLSLALRAAGVEPAAIGAQLVALHPDAAPLAGIGAITAEQARAMLADDGVA